MIMGRAVCKDRKRVRSSAARVCRGAHGKCLWCTQVGVALSKPEEENYRVALARTAAVLKRISLSDDADDQNNRTPFRSTRGIACCRTTTWSRKGFQKCVQRVLGVNELHSTPLLDEKNSPALPFLPSPIPASHPDTKGGKQGLAFEVEASQ